MKKEIVNVNYEDYLNKNVKIFKKGKQDPITGKVIVIKKRFILILAKKAIKQENKFIYRKGSVKKETIDRIDII